MSLFICCARNPADSSGLVALREENGQKVVEEVTRITFMDGCHSPNLIEMLKEKGGFQWTEEHFFMYHVMGITGNEIKAAEAIKLSEVANMSLPLSGRTRCSWTR